METPLTDVLSALVSPGSAGLGGFAHNARFGRQDDGVFPRAQHATQVHLHLGAAMIHALQQEVVQSAIALEAEPVVRGQARRIMAPRRLATEPVVALQPPLVIEREPAVLQTQVEDAFALIESGRCSEQPRPAMRAVERERIRFRWFSHVPARDYLLSAAVGTAK